MARQIQAPDDQIRVVFAPDEAARFLRGWEPVPDFGGDDPLNRAIQQSYDQLNDAFPDAGEQVELCVELAPWANDDGRGWRVVNFRFAQDGVERAGHDADAVADWIAEYTPDLLFAVESGRGTTTAPVTSGAIPSKAREDHVPRKKKPITDRPKVEDESVGNPPEKHGKHQPGDEGLPGKGGTKGGLNRDSGVGRREGAGSKHRRPPDSTRGTKQNRGRPKGKKLGEGREQTKSSRGRGPERKA